MRQVAIATAILAVAIAAVPANAPAAPVESLSPAAQSLARCVQTNGELSVLMLIDESGSLATTDPFNQRVDGIRAALTGLANLSETPVGGRRPHVSVLMAGFFGLVHPDPEDGVPASAWKPVTRDDIDEMLEDAGQYEALNHGRATDYVTALLAARQLLAARAAEQTQEGGAAPCQALIWFTDGRYSLPLRVGRSGVGLPLTVPYAPGIRLDRPGAGNEAVAAGKRLMCKPNGLMDDLQGDGVIRFTVALSAQLSSEDAAFLEAATTGSATGQRCGVHLSQSTGQYLTARDGDRLFFAFANLLGSESAVRVAKVCPKLICVRGITTFGTVPGLSRFLIRASGSAQRVAGGKGTALNLELRAPDGQSATLKPDAPTQLQMAGTEITQRWVSDRAVEVQGDFSANSRSWIGKWSYAFVDPVASSSDANVDGYSSAQLFADLEPSVDGDPVLIRGVPTRLTFRLEQGSTSEPVTSGALVRSARLTASIDDPVAGTSTDVPVVGPSSDGSFTAMATVPRTSTTGFVYLGLSANLSTPGGTPIAPQYRSFDVPVRLPPGQGFPTITPASLDLPSMEGLGEAEGTFTVRGSSASGGCVWVGTPEIEAPSNAGRIDAVVAPAANSESSCIQLEKGEERQLTVRLTPSAEASGTVTASLPVRLRSDIVDGSRLVSVPLTFVMTPAPNEAARAALLVALVGLGALAPLLLLHALNRMSARFPPPNRLRAIVLPVELSRSGGLRRSDGEEAGDAIGRGDPLYSLGTSRTRELSVGGLKLETVASGSLKHKTFELFRGPYAVATADGRRLLAGCARPLRSWCGGTAQEVPLSLLGTWILRVDAVRPAETGDDEPVDEASLPGAPAPEQAEGAAYFAPTMSQATPAEDAAPAVASRGAGDATVEGQLVLLISERPPHDQGKTLYEQAAQELKSADVLWEEDAVIARDSRAGSAAPEQGPEEGEQSSEAPASSGAPRGEEAEHWSPASEQAGRGTDKRSGGDYF